MEINPSCDIFHVLFIAKTVSIALQTLCADHFGSPFIQYSIPLTMGSWPQENYYIRLSSGARFRCIQLFDGLFIHRDEIDTISARCGGK